MRVLFVGNSYTLYHDVPAQVAALVASLGGTRPTIEPHSVLQGGADWKLHRESLGTPARIAEGFDAVVLQGKSTDPLLARFAFARHGAALACLARRHGAGSCHRTSRALEGRRGRPRAPGVRRAAAALALAT